VWCCLVSAGQPTRRSIPREVFGRDEKIAYNPSGFHLTILGGVCIYIPQFTIPQNSSRGPASFRAHLERDLVSRWIGNTSEW